MGSDPCRSGCRNYDAISIHAPRMGSDRLVMRRRCSRMHFNPRSPDGERRSFPRRARRTGRDFNPRSPDGERRPFLASAASPPIFQSTLPGWGATCPRRCRSCRRWHFNPRSPDGERLRGHVPPVRRVRISIHAPRMGSDSGYGARRQGSYISIHAPRMGSDSWRPRATVIIMIFQSTLPGWGATLMLLEAVHGIVISIHAPRMGSDHTPSLAGFDCKDFNPRSPDGERPIGRPYPRSLIYFNPRSPDGERLAPWVPT